MRITIIGHIGLKSDERNGYWIIERWLLEPDDLMSPKVPRTTAPHAMVQFLWEESSGLLLAST